MKTDTTTNPASVAARLTDEEILLNASRVDELSYDGEIGSCGGFSCGDNSPNTEEVSAVLRDYVRMRKDYAQAIEIARHNYKELKLLLAEAEKGDVK